MKQTEETNQLVSWYDSWGEGLFRLAFYRLASRQDAEDVVQDAFLKISGAYPGYFVPCRLLKRSGEEVEINLALRNDNPNQVWLVDGGL